MEQPLTIKGTVGALESADAVRTCLRFTHLHRDFALQVEGIDLGLAIDDRTFVALQQAFERRSLLVFPNQAIDTERLVAFAERFGAVDIVKVGSVGAGTKVSTVGNVLPDGTLAAPDSQLGLVARANQLWHSDGSYKAQPPMASLMHARLLPPFGGETEFISMRAVWKRLPEHMRNRIAKRTAVHSYAASRDRIDPGLMTAKERNALPPVSHPLVHQSPTTGEKALFIGSHVACIEGIPQEESRKLLDELLSLACDERFLYQHAWRKGDVILWDNRAVIHRGRPWDMRRYPRQLFHLSILGPRDSALPLTLECAGGSSK